MQSNYLPPLEPIGDFRSYVCGDVVIDRTAAIASGVLLQADQGGRITIAAGVCIGMGAVLHAQGGLLEVGAGANLGAGVLVYGTSKIGEGACIGASSSIVRAVIAKGAIVPPCSLISGLEQGAVEKEASPAIAKELEINNQTSPTNHSFTHTYSSVHTNVTATTDSLVANSVERTVTETQVEIPNMLIADTLIADTLIADTLIADTLIADNISESSLESTENETESNASTDSSISTLATANSAQAKAYAQAQINRYIKRLFPN